MKQSIRTNIVYNTIRTIVGVLFPLITFPYATHVLGPESLGKVQYYIAFVNYFILFSGLGVTYYAVREGSKYKNNPKALSELVGELIALLSISTLLSYGLLFLLAPFFFKVDYTLLGICSLNIVATTFNIEWLYIIKEEYKYITIRSLVFQVLSLFVLFAFVKSPQDYCQYAVFNIIGTIGTALFNIIKARKMLSFRFSFGKLMFRHIKPVMIFFGSTLATTIYMNLDTVMIGYFRGDFDVGQYSAAVKFSYLIKVVISSISAVLFPRLSYYVANNQLSDYTALLKKGILTILIILLPCALGLCSISKESLLLLCGQEFIEANYATKILSINIIFSVIDSILFYQILIPNKQEKKACIATIIGASSNFILNLFIIPKWSYTGAAITTMISECLVFVFLAFEAKKYFSFAYVIKNFLILSAVSSSAFVMHYVSVCVFTGYIARLTFTVTLTGLIYAIFLAIFEKESFRYLINKIKARNYI